MFQRPKVSRTILAIMCAMSFIMYLDRVNLSAAAGLIRDDLHLSNTNVGLVFAAFAYTYAICQVIGGWVSDRFGAKLTLVTCAQASGSSRRSPPVSRAASSRCSARACCSASAKGRLCRPRPAR